MRAAARSMRVRLQVSAPMPLAAAAGDRLVLTLRTSCPAARDRTGMMVSLIAPDGGVAAHAFVSHDGTASETDAIALQAPAQVGEHLFRFVLPPHEIGGDRFPEAALNVPVRVRPQQTSLAVWAVPSPVVAGAPFVIKAGAKSTAGCALAGRSIEVRDRAGAVAASGRLSDAPLPGTNALYWTEMALVAPRTAGLASWSVRFTAEDLDLPHEGAATTFAVAVVPAPEHTLTVKVVEKDTAVPVADVELRLGAFRGATGASGVAEIRMPKGTYELRLWKVGYDAPPQSVQIGADAVIEVEALTITEEDPDARWKM